jgi:hypothetical protein
MRRSQFAKLVGLSEEALNLLRARKHVPLRGRPIGPGWKELFGEDAVAMEAAAALARCGVKKNDAREWVDLYFKEGLDRAAEQRGRRGQRQPIYLGVVTSVGIADGMPVEDDHFPLVGTASEVAEELERIGEMLGGDRWLNGAITINLNLCAKLVSIRAHANGIVDEQLSQLEGILC